MTVVRLYPGSLVIDHGAYLLFIQCIQYLMLDIGNFFKRSVCVFLTSFYHQLYVIVHNLLFDVDCIVCIFVDLFTAVIKCALSGSSD